jgi:hypothetical protein
LVSGVRALSPRERKSLAASLGTLAQAMGIETGAANMFFEERKGRTPRRSHVGR